jgi:hypothetical protein
MKSSKLVHPPLLLLIAILYIPMLPAPLYAQTTSNPANLPQRDGSHDFDFVIGNWKAHVRRLPDRLNNSTNWVEYDGISNHKKLLDSNSNFEEFDVSSADKKLRIKAQTLRPYNPTSRQWSIYLVDVDNGTLSLPPVVGQFKPLTSDLRLRTSGVRRRTSKPQIKMKSQRRRTRVSVQHGLVTSLGQKIVSTFDTKVT